VVFLDSLSVLGNAIVHCENILIPQVNLLDEKEKRLVYIILYPEGIALKRRLQHAIDSFMGISFDVSSSSSHEWLSEIDKEEKQALESKSTVALTKRNFKKYLEIFNLFEEVVRK
jgi:hypothetical protein